MDAASLFCKNCSEKKVISSKRGVQKANTPKEVTTKIPLGVSNFAVGTPKVGKVKDRTQIHGSSHD